jgi:hypothetical protein
MRKRGRHIDYGSEQRGATTIGHSTSVPSAGYKPEPTYKHSEVPKEWRKYAREPWRILFPDLEWTPPDKDE